MSQISRARQRMFNKRGATFESNVRESRSNPRKFTVSSLTHNLDHRPSQPNISPSLVLGRDFQRPLETPVGSKTQRSFISRAKENTPMLKTVNIKIAEMSQLGISRIGSQGQDRLDLQSHFQQSPPKVNYRRPLHRQKIQLILAPPPDRRHHSPYKPRECLRGWADGILSEARALGRGFVDDFFPPARTIVFNRKILYQEQGLKFQKLSRIYNCDTFLVNNCEPTLLSLGKYTNPYLYSALTILAEDPSRVLALFGGQESSEDGAYHVCLCKDGVWRYVIVDDFMPIKSVAGRKQMLFMHSRQTERGVQFWAALVQKAMAKIYGTYFDLAMVREEGMIQLFRILTGAPVSTYIINKDFRAFLILIDAALKRGHIVTLEAIPQENTQTALIRNLSIHQAYRLLQIKKTGLKIRNYAEPQLITRLAFDQCLIFGKIVIYRLEPTYRYITYKLRHKKKFYSKLSVSVPATTRCYFDVWQNNPAYYKKHLGSNISYQLSRSRMWFCRQGQDDGQWLESGKAIELDEGAYELHVHLCQDREYDFTVSYYGEKDISFQRIKCSQQWLQPCLCFKQ